MSKYYFLLPLVIFLASCSGASPHFAPLDNGWKTRYASQTYRVQPSDTLYSVAFHYELDADKLAQANHLSPPYHIIPGQMLTLLPEATDTTSTPPASAPVVVGAAPLAEPITSQPVKSEPVKNVINSAPTASPTLNPKSNLNLNGTGAVGNWSWPTSGKIIQGYSNVYAGNKGIDIAGKMGDPIKATNAGRVVYAGTGLRGYGQLIIIKHNAKYLSAYAHNSEMLVKEGDTVTRGQVIAKMGDSGATQTMLHFEIRQSGSPVDPLKLLPPRKG